MRFGDQQKAGMLLFVYLHFGRSPTFKAKVVEIRTLSLSINNKWSFGYTRDLFV